jgi:GTP cyclohydrolase I
MVRRRDISDGNDTQRTVADIDLSVDLPAEFKGTHMSRFIESIQYWTEHSDALDYAAMRQLLLDMRDRLSACNAHVTFRFPYFMTRPAPSSARPASMPYQCTLTGELDASDNPTFTLDVTVPVMTVCPCSKAISDEGAHSQRADVRMKVKMNGRIWIEELIEIAESAGSSPVYTLLKREDEKFVTEHAFANPMFVEDVVRNVAIRLNQHPLVSSYSVEVESYESIHAHNAFACIEHAGEHVY